MAYSTCLPVAFVLTVLALAAPSCGLGGSCNCPNEPNPPTASVFVEPAEASPIVAVAADSPCTAQILSMQNRSWITVSSMKAGICRVLAQLANGAAYAVDVDFESMDLGCCGTTIQARDFPSISRTDAGIDARS